MRRVISVLLILALCSALLAAAAEEAAPAVPGGYWESGCDYYLQIEDDRLILRDYARRIVLDTFFTAQAVSDGSMELIPGESGLSYEEKPDNYAEITQMCLENGEIRLNVRFIASERDEEYMLRQVENGPFDHIIILDDEVLPEFEGVWHEPDQEWTMEISGAHLCVYPDDYPDNRWIDADIHAIRYSRDETDGTVYLVPEDLTADDFGGFTFFDYCGETLNTIMIVYDAEDMLYFRFEKLDGAEIREPDPYVFNPLTDDPDLCYKPVIYLYPDHETQIDVRLGPGMELTCAYPAYDGGWHVSAQPDGTLTDDNGQQYNYLYWEGACSIEWDFSRGFCVPGGETAEFLETALAQLGLSRREANEFIVYWLPQMQDSAYNLIAFQGENYARAAQLAVTPEPDCVNRVFMAWKRLDAPVEIEAQALSAPETGAFNVVEWGGTPVE